MNKLWFLLLALLPFSAHATMPFTFATMPSGNVAASTLDTNFTFLEAGTLQGVLATGSTNSYILTPADAWTTGYSQYVNRALTVTFNANNSGATTVNVSGLGSTSVFKNVGGVATPLAAGDIYAGIPYVIACDGTNFWLQTPSFNTSTPPLTHSIAFTVSGTYVFTPSTTGIVLVKVWGSGGGGGNATTASGHGGGGGGGGYTERYLNVVALASSTVTVGGGGAGTVAGATSSFVGAAVVVSATGGSPGVTSTNNNTIWGGGVGGAGSNGAVNLTGGHGEGGLANGTTGTYRGGWGGYGAGGGGGGGNDSAGSFAASYNGGNGVGPGGGGGGAYRQASDAVGGTGADGMVVVEYP